MSGAKRWIPLTIGLFVAVVCGSAVLHLESAERERLRNEERLSSLDSLSAIRARLEGSLNAMLLLPRGLAAALAVDPDLDEARLERLSAELMANRGHLRNIAVSRRYVVRFVFPLEGNEAVLGLDYLANEEQRDAVMRSVGTRQPVVAGPLELAQAGTALVGRIPVFETPPDGTTGSGRFVGLVSAPINLHGVLRDAGLFEPDLPIRVAIRGRDGLGAYGEVFFGDRALFDGDAVTLDVNLPGGRWQLAAVARRQATESSLLAVRLLGGMLTALVAVLGVAGSRYWVWQQAASDDLRSLLTRAPFAIIAARQADGRVSFLNDRAAELLAGIGLDRGNDITQLLSEEAWHYLLSATRGMHGVDGHELPLPGESGAARWVLLSAGRLVFDGAPVICLALADISRAKLAEEELKKTVDALSRSNAELERFAYVASHDLQEPLRTVISYTQFLERRCGPVLQGDCNDFLQYIVGGARRMHALVNDLLAYSRVGSQGRPFQGVPIADVVASVMEALRESLRSSDGEIEVAGELPVVRGDVIQIVQLFQNLIGNALKFRTPERSPRITIAAQPDGEFWRIQVRDNGIGIEAQYLPVIFDVFKRLHTADTYPGTGIGLSICKRVIERHGGRIWAESQAGQGTTFWFTLPAEPETCGNAVDDPDTPAPASLTELPVSVDTQMHG